MTNDEVIKTLKADGVDVSAFPADKLAQLGKGSPEELKALASLMKKTGTAPGTAVPLDGGLFF